MKKEENTMIYLYIRITRCLQGRRQRRYIPLVKYSYIHPARSQDDKLIFGTLYMSSIISIHKETYLISINWNLTERTKLYLM